MRRWGPGPQCSPRSSPPRSSGRRRRASRLQRGAVATTAATGSAAVGLDAAGVLIVLALLFTTTMVALMATWLPPATATAIGSGYPAPLTIPVDIPDDIVKGMGVAATYGGELAEVIRFMDGEDDMEYCMEVQTEVAAIEALPCVVGAVQFTYSEDKVNNNKVKAVMGCCWSSGRLAREQVCPRA